jgi:hypothetical protein
MRPAIHALCASIAFCGGACSTSLYSDSKEFRDYERGAERAARDLVQGRYRTLDNGGPIMVYGMEAIKRELRTRYGIQETVDHSRSGDYAMGYNAIMHAAAKERFGNDYYKKLLPNFGGPLQPRDEDSDQ